MLQKNSKTKIIISTAVVVLFWVLVLFNFSSFYSTKDNIVKFNFIYLIITILSSAMLFFMGAFTIKVKNERKWGIISYVTAIIGAMVVSILFSGGFTSTPYIFLVNTAFYLCVAALILIISANVRASAIGALVASYLFNGISFLVYCFRGWSLTPTDLVAVGTAMNVASEYKFKLSCEIFSSTALLAILIMMLYKFPWVPNEKSQKGNSTIRYAGAGVLIASVIFIGSVDSSKYDISVYNQHKANITAGSAYSFYVNFSKIGLKASENYDPQALDEKLISYEPDVAEAMDMTQVPNVLVVMNESFSDLSVVGDFETNVDYMPFVKSLEENTIKGQTLVSPFGGYTCNSEYEFLTGMSTSLFETQQAPYMQMIFNYLPYSLPWHMKQMGYQTFAIHPYYGDGWNRNTVYPYMGFDDYISIEDFEAYNENPEYIRRYITDRSNYDAVMKYLEDKDDNERAFIYNITMQNHGGYTDEEFESEVLITDMNGQYPNTEQYLTLVKNADEDLKYLIERLSEFDEPLVLVVFGDHLPSVEPEFFEELYGASLDSLGPEELYKRYVTPFFIWANFDIPEQQNVKTSPCFLSNMMMEVANLPKSRVQLYLDDLQTEIAQINQLCYFDNDGIMHEHSDSERLQEYYDLQYALLTGEGLSYDFYNYKNSKRILGENLLKPSTYTE